MRFLKDKQLFISLQVGFIIFLTVLLSNLKVDTYAILFVDALLLGIDSLILGVEYAKKRRFYKALEDSLEGLDKKCLISELIEKPNFEEGIILYEVLKSTTKSMNDEIAKYKRSQEEYKSYIETWIHEIKTPMACMGLICTNNKNEITKGINEQLAKVSFYIEQVLFYARSTSVERDYIISENTLLNMVRSSIKLSSRQLIEAKVKIEMENLDYKVFADTKWLEFILGQLIANSLKYRKEAPSLYFYGKEDKSQIILGVRDNGVGIPERDLSRVCEKGFTGENGRKYAKSTGIGLYLCQNLCQKLHLGFNITSKVNEGTTVEIIFPKDKAILFEP